MEGKAETQNEDREESCLIRVENSMPLKTHQDDQPTLNLTPMIDIVFLLIIFFMVGTKFAEMESNIKLDVPRVKETGTLTAAPDKKIINVFENGKIVMDNQEYDVDQLRSSLQNTVSQYSDLGVVIRGDAQEPLQNIATILTAVRQAGVSDMGISVRLDRKLR